MNVCKPLENFLNVIQHFYSQIQQFFSCVAGLSPCLAARPPFLLPARLPALPVRSLRGPTVWPTHRWPTTATDCLSDITHAAVHEQFKAVNG